MPAQPRDLTPDRSPRHFFGSEIRHHRTCAGMSIADLGEQVRYSKSHLANIEAAHRTPPPDLPPLLDTALPSADGFFTRFYPLVSTDSFPDWSRRYMTLEPLANTHLKFSLSIPGLWQTENYGRAFLRLGRPRASEEEIRERWNRRQARQQILHSPAPPFMWVVLDEAAVRRDVGSPEITREQIRHVINIAQGANATVQILPIDRPHGAMGGSLTLLHFDDAPRVAYLEGVQSGQLIEAPHQVTDMALIYDTLRAEALTPDDSMAWLQRASEDHPE
ncbi:Scr1 family TA system antitoxin-like transcriptional regulator [Streptomyces novaecaesareae]|uniref:Scr1 family TA system antitoxin-like transcriptional regulator n=1 Tax=Streptomyces novaecaesareae TaxID=68244 RepID=UPI0004AB8574